MTTGRINQVSYCCNYLLQPTSRRRPLKASISELTARLGGYALASINLLVLDTFPQTQLKTYTVCFKWIYAASNLARESNLMTGILASESKHRMLDLQEDNCRLTSFPRSVDIWHPINPHLTVLATPIRSETSCSYWNALCSDRSGSFSHATFSLCV